MRKTRRSRTPLGTFDQINVTPLLDLTFLLLIAFMITMPLMEYGTPINEPEMNSDPLPTENFKSITITDKGTILLGQDPVSRDELLSRLNAMQGQNPKPQLLLRASGDRSYKEVIELMALIRRSGFSDITLVTQAEKE